MKIDKTFKIKEKYFNAILSFEKPFELRHEKVEPNSIIKLECENGRYLVFRSGKCIEQEYFDDGICFNNFTKLKKKGYHVYLTEKECFLSGNDYLDQIYEKYFDGYDKFCGEYVNKAPTYLIEIAEILEVK